MLIILTKRRLVDNYRTKEPIEPIEEFLKGKKDEVVSTPLALAVAKQNDLIENDKEETKTISFTPSQSDVYTKNSSCELLKQCPSENLNFKDKILIIGAGYEDSTDKFSIPKTFLQEESHITGAELVARLTDSILNESLFNYSPQQRWDTITFLYAM